MNIARSGGKQDRTIIEAGTLPHGRFMEGKGNPVDGESLFRDFIEPCPEAGSDFAPVVRDELFGPAIAHQGDAGNFPGGQDACLPDFFMPTAGVFAN